MPTFERRESTPVFTPHIHLSHHTSSSLPSSSSPSPSKKRRLNAPSSSSSSSTIAHSAGSSTSSDVETQALSSARLQSSMRVVSIWNSLAAKYTKGLAEDDIVDLVSLKVLQDKGVLRNAQDDQYAIGSLGDTNDSPKTTGTNHNGDDEEETDDEEDDTVRQENDPSVDSEPEIPPHPALSRRKSLASMATSILQEEEADLQAFLRAEEERRKKEGDIDADLDRAHAALAKATPDPKPKPKPKSKPKPGLIPTPVPEPTHQLKDEGGDDDEQEEDEDEDAESSSEDELLLSGAYYYSSSPEAPSKSSSRSNSPEPQISPLNHSHVSRSSPSSLPSRPRSSSQSSSSLSSSSSSSFIALHSTTSLTSLTPQPPARDNPSPEYATNDTPSSISHPRRQLRTPPPSHASSSRLGRSPAASSLTNRKHSPSKSSTPPLRPSRLASPPISRLRPSPPRKPIKRKRSLLDAFPPRSPSKAAYRNPSLVVIDLSSDIEPDDDAEKLGRYAGHDDDGSEDEGMMRSEATLDGELDAPVDLDDSDSDGEVNVREARDPGEERQPRSLVDPAAFGSHLSIPAVSRDGMLPPDPNALAHVLYTLNYLAFNNLQSTNSSGTSSSSNPATSRSATPFPSVPFLQSLTTSMQSGRKSKAPPSNSGLNPVPAPAHRTPTVSSVSSSSPSASTLRPKQALPKSKLSQNGVQLPSPSSHLTSGSVKGKGRERDVSTSTSRMPNTSTPRVDRPVNPSPRLYPSKQSDARRIPPVPMVVLPAPSFRVTPVASSSSPVSSTPRSVHVKSVSTPDLPSTEASSTPKAERTISNFKEFITPKTTRFVKGRGNGGGRRNGYD